MTTNWRKMFPDAKRSKVDFLIDGAQYFESVAAMIEKATGPSHYIYILGWMLDLDFPLVQADKSKTLFELLRNASASVTRKRKISQCFLIDVGYSSIAAVIATAIRPKVMQIPLRAFSCAQSLCMNALKGFLFFFLYAVLVSPLSLEGARLFLIISI